MQTIANMLPDGKDLSNFVPA